MRRLITTMALFISTAGCTSVEPLRPDMEARSLPSRADEIAYINQLRLAFVPQAQLGTNVPCYTGEKLPPFRPKYTQGYQEWDVGQEAGGWSGQCLLFRTGTDSQIKDYLEAGFGLTDLYCQRYFTIATETRQSRRLQRSLFKTGDILTTAILAALNGVSNLKTFSNAGFAAADSVYGDIDDAFVVAPSRDDLRKLVLSAQQDYRSHVFSDWPTNKEKPHSYQSARTVIERYAGLCSFDGMRQLVADSVADKTNQLNTDADQKRGDTLQPQTPAPVQQQSATPAPKVPAKNSKGAGTTSIAGAQKGTHASSAATEPSPVPITPE